MSARFAFPLVRATTEFPAPTPSAHPDRPGQQCPPDATGSALVLVIAGFLVLSILHTTVVAQTRDIGILNAIGGSVGGIMSIILINEQFIVVIGPAICTVAVVLIIIQTN